MGLILLPEERSEREAELLAVPAPPTAAVVARLSHEQYASRARLVSTHEESSRRKHTKLDSA
jgi:hypothetical protein